MRTCARQASDASCASAHRGAVAGLGLRERAARGRRALGVALQRHVNVGPRIGFCPPAPGAANNAAVISAPVVSCPSVQRATSTPFQNLMSIQAHLRTPRALWANRRISEWTSDEPSRAWVRRCVWGGLLLLPVMGWRWGASGFGGRFGLCRRQNASAGVPTRVFSPGGRIRESFFLAAELASRTARSACTSAGNVT